MKTKILIIGTTLAVLSTLQAQDIPQNQVPSVIVNEFNKEFSKATDIEWEMDGNLYNVDFEIGWNIDHEVWYNTEGKIVKHKKDISKKELPKTVKNRLEKSFKGYTIDDLEQITDNKETVYKMELKSLTKTDWDIVIDASCNVLSKIAD